MRKIPTLFVRDPEDRRYVTDQVTPGCEWVLAGEGDPTRKYDGTCVLLLTDGTWWARREVKSGKSVPAGFVSIETDETTGKTVGWEPIEQSPFAKFHAEALADDDWPYATDPGTYELIGPKINGNPEKASKHELILHDRAAYFAFATPGCDDVPADPEGLYVYLGGFMSSLKADGVEGIVWHHPDGRMAKLKVKDFR